MPQPPRSEPAPRKRQERRRHLLQTAGELFLEQGYDGVSLDAIVAAAGGSKTTLYSYFGNKDGLLVAVVEYLCAEFLDPLRHIELETLTLEQGLESILHELVSVVTSHRHVSFYRLVVSAGVRVPDVGNTWHEHGPQVWYRLFERFLAARRPDRAEQAPGLAHILFDALFSHLMIRTVMLGRVDATESMTPLIAELVEIVRTRLGD